MLTINAKSCSPKSQPNRRGSKLINSIAVLINLSVLQNYDQELKLFNGLPDHTLDAQSGWFASAKQAVRSWNPFLNRTPQLPSNLPTLPQTLPDKDLTPSKPQVSCPEIDAPTDALGSNERWGFIMSRIGRLFTQNCFDNFATINERTIRLQLTELADFVQEYQKTHPNLAEKTCRQVLDKIEACEDPHITDILGHKYSRLYLSNLFCMARDANNGISNNTIRCLMKRMMEVSLNRPEWNNILKKVIDDMENKGNNTEERFIKDSKLEKQLNFDSRIYGKAFMEILRVEDTEGWNKWFTKYVNPKVPLTNLKVCHYLLDMADSEGLWNSLSTLPRPDINDPSNRMTMLINAALQEATGDFAGHRKKLLNRIRSMAEREEKWRDMLSTWSDTVQTIMKQ